MDGVKTKGTKSINIKSWHFRDKGTCRSSRSSSSEY